MVRLSGVEITPQPVLVTIDSRQGLGYANPKDPCQSKRQGKSEIIRGKRAFEEPNTGGLGEKGKTPPDCAARDLEA
jgi:hypothetical protein